MPPERAPKKHAGKEVPLHERSAWFSTDSFGSLRNIVWCSRVDGPVVLVFNEERTDEPTLTCPGCKLDYDPEGDWDHTFLGNAVKPY